MDIKCETGDDEPVNKKLKTSTTAVSVGDSPSATGPTVQNSKKGKLVPHVNEDEEESVEESKQDESKADDNYSDVADSDDADRRFVKAKSKFEGMSKEELDERIKTLMTSLQKAKKPMQWNTDSNDSGLIHSMDESVELTLYEGWDNFQYETYYDEVREFLLPSDYVCNYVSVDEDMEDKYDPDAAFKTLFEKGYIDLSEYAYDSSGSMCWEIFMDKKKTITTSEANDIMINLFQGGLCIYPEGYDNYGETLFIGREKEYEEIMDSVAIVLQRTKEVSYITFEATCQDENYLAEKQLFAFFELESGQKILLKFRSVWDAR